MNWLAEKTIKHKGVIIIAFTLMIVFSIFAAPNVSINYQMADYLPEDSKSTVSLNLMNKEFDKSPPNVRIMLEDVSIAEALNYKEKISKDKLYSYTANLIEVKEAFQDPVQPSGAF